MIKKYINREKGTNDIGQGMKTNINNVTVTIKNSYKNNHSKVKVKNNQKTLNKE